MKNEDTTQRSDARELWTAFSEAVGYTPDTDTPEWKGWRSVIAQWAKVGLTAADVRRAVRGYEQAHPHQPVTPWGINESPRAYIALVTTREVKRTTVATDPTSTYGVVEPTGDETGPPEDVLRQFRVVE